MKRKELMLVSALCVCTLFSGCSNSKHKEAVNEISPSVDAPTQETMLTETPATEEPTTEEPTTEEPGTEKTEIEITATQVPENQNPENSKAISLFEDYMNGTAKDGTELKEEDVSLFRSAKTTNKDFEKFSGEWHRTNCHSSFGGTLSITNANEKEFDVEGEFYYYSHMGDLYDVKGYYISDTKAVIEYIDYTQEPDSLILLDLDNETMEVIGIGGKHFEFGMNVSLEGTYTLDEPEYTNSNVLNETFSNEEQTKIEKFFKNVNIDYEEYFLLTVQNGGGSMSDVTVELDNKKTKSGKWFSGFLPTMGGYDIELFLSEDGHIYYENSTQGFKTDDKSVKSMPVQQ